MKLTAEDRLDILDLCARFNDCFTRRDVDGVMDCWADGDIRWETINGTFTGRAAVRAQQEKNAASVFFQSKRFLGGNVIIRPGERDGEAAVTCDLVILEINELPQVALTGSCADRVVRTPAGWRYAHRKLALDFGFSRWLQQNPHQQQALPGRD
jgi:hypothetical protein